MPIDCFQIGDNSHKQKWKKKKGKRESTKLCFLLPLLQSQNTWFHWHLQCLFFFIVFFLLFFLIPNIFFLVCYSFIPASCENLGSGALAVEILTQLFAVKSNIHVSAMRRASDLPPNIKSKLLSLSYANPGRNRPDGTLAVLVGVITFQVSWDCAKQPLIKDATNTINIFRQLKAVKTIEVLHSWR